MTTEIRSAQGTRKILQLDTIDTRSDSDLMVTIIDPVMGGVPIAIHTAELAAALGLVTREAHREQVAAVQKERDEARKDVSIAGMHSETYRVKYEVAEEARAMLDRTARELRAELDEAEATIARVREELDALGRHWPDWAERIRAALDPKPAFVLPTEAGAGITAHAVDWTTTRIEFRLFSDGLWHAQNGKGYVPDQIMTRFTDHRLIGAEE